MAWIIATGGLAGAVVSYAFFHLNPVPGLVLTILVLAALGSKAEA